jgi:two-component system cell cycle response regulator
MRLKILTVDDSKTVRLIIRKTFKPFDCEILEAANGVEGLAVASKSAPDLILLDVTMPVMDGVEMLTRLKADPKLRNIPVMMLTAEGGRDNVLSIAKIGIRGYIVKPFKEDAMIEKVSRIVDLKPVSESPGKARSILDPLDLLVVEDKPAILQQFEQGLKHTPWKIHGVASQGEAIDFCGRATPDLVVVSLSLAGDSAFALFRILRASLKTKFTPIFALVVKTESEAQAQAQKIGFTAIVTKPIDMADLESKVAKAMNLDTSKHYFRSDGEFLVVDLPQNCSNPVLAEAAQYLAPKLAEAVDAGHSLALIDLSAVRSLHLGIIKFIVQATQSCRELTIHLAIVGSAPLIAEFRSFEETRSWSFHETIDGAKAGLKQQAQSPADAPQAVEA